MSLISKHAALTTSLKSTRRGRCIWTEKSRLRLIGIDIGLDKGPVARQAVEFVRGRVEGREITLEFDRERKDRQGRLLAYVYSDGTLLNEDLIRSGLGPPRNGCRYRPIDGHAVPPCRAMRHARGPRHLGTPGRLGALNGSAGLSTIVSLAAIGET